MKKLILVVSLVLLSACGGGDPCEPHTWDTRMLTDLTDEASVVIRCSEFQCPGYPAQRRCWIL